MNLDLGDLVLADIDLDGDLDAIASVCGIAGTDFRFAVWANRGDATFADPAFHLAGFGPIGIAVADFTGALGQDPTHEGAAANRGTVRLRAGHSRLACTDWANSCARRIMEACTLLKRMCPWDPETGRLAIPEPEAR